MIQVVRAKKPALLVKHQKAWTEAIQSATTEEERKIAQGKYAHKDIRNALEKMFHDKCAYCESSISHVSYGNIEHFKPKSDPRYYSLAVSWNNLLLSCSRCNSAENKGTKFPGVRDGGPLINPSKENPEEHFRFEYDRKAGLASVIGTTKRGTTSEIIFGLNRPKLTRRRSKLIKRLIFIAESYKTDAAAKELIDEAARDSEEYSAFAKAIIKLASL